MQALFSQGCLFFTGAFNALENSLAVARQRLTP